MKYSSCALAGLVGLAACDTPTTTQTTTQVVTPATRATEAVPASSPGSRYQVYRGLLPGQADSITLHLVTAAQPRYDRRGPTTQGSYYGADGHPYELGSEPSAPDSLVLRDYSPEHSTGPNGPGPAWRLRQLPGGSLTGTVAGGAVRLRPVAPAAGLSFAVRSFADSLAAHLPGLADSPKAHFYFQALEPVGGPTPVRRELQANMERDLRGDTLSNLPPVALPALYKQLRTAFYKDYREQVADLTPPADTADLGSYRASLSFEEQRTTYVLYQQQDLLSLAFFGYTYTGGAHGLDGTTVASYDLRTGRRLRYSDIFRPDATQQLSALLGRAVRPLVGLQPNDPLDKQLFVKQMPVTHNVLLTAGGVLFMYQPYEIASYAQGEVHVFLPMSAVRALLREGLPLPGTSGVAAR